MRLLRRRPKPRLPQDVAAEGADPPDPSRWTRSVADYALQHATALGADDHAQRADALWGLVARGDGSLPWVSGELASQDERRVADAAGVLAWTGAPRAWRARLSALAAALPDGEAADTLWEVLGPDPHDADPAGSTDGQLLDGALSPFSDTVWFVEAELDQTVDEVRSWRAGLGKHDRFEALTAPLPQLLTHLEPFALPGWKQLIVGTRSPWTAVFSQQGDTHLAEIVGRRLVRRHLKTEFTPHVVRDGVVVNYGSRTFELEDPVSAPGCRTIQASYQSRWSWHLYGEPQPFEELESYGERRIPDRFTLARLNAYCRALGIERDDPGFYGPDAVLLTEDTRTWVRQPSNTMPSHAWRSAHLT